MSIATKPPVDRLAAARNAAQRISDRLKSGRRPCRDRPQLRIEEPAIDEIVTEETPAEVPASAAPRPAGDLVASPDLEEYLVSVEVVTVTPALAAEWLKANAGNRKLNARAAQRYGTAMKAARWRLNGETIIFDWLGQLRNGQHRLTGCVVSGASFTTLVVRGVDPEAFETMDTGRGRTGSDVLGLLGHANTSCLSAASVLLIRYRAGELPVRNGNRKIEHYEIREVAEANPGLNDSILAAAPARRLASPSVLAFCHYAFGEVDPALAKEFFAKLSTGANMEEDDPILSLRNRLIKNRGAKAKLGGMELIALIFKAFKYARAGQKVGRTGLVWRSTGPSPEPFPKLTD